MDRIQSVEAAQQEIRNSYDVALISNIDRKMKELFDKLLHLIEDLSLRLSQMETKTHRLENAIDDLKVSAEYNYGRTDGKLRQLENILQEVQDGVQFLRDKQEIAETQVQLDKLQVSKGSLQSENKSTAKSAQQETSTSPQQSRPPIPNSGTLLLDHPALPPNISTVPNQTTFPSAASVLAPVSPQIPQNQIPPMLQSEFFYPPSGQASQNLYQQYDIPATQLAQPPPSAPYHPYQSAPQLPQVSHSSQLPQLQLPLGAFNPQNRPPSGYLREQKSYLTSHIYTPRIKDSSFQPAGGAPSQNFHMASSQAMQSQHLKRSCSELPTGYTQTPEPAEFNEMHPYGGSFSHSSSSTMRPLHRFTSSAMDDGIDYERPPKAPVIPYALPTASSVDGGSGSGTAGNRLPIDDVVERVTAMGFRRDLARATARKLTENGQSVDLNVVLDKLMNNGDGQQQKGWSDR
ncbi:unnamed protein product [Ilex paraguariensis]